MRYPVHHSHPSSARALLALGRHSNALMAESHGKYFVTTSAGSTTSLINIARCNHKHFCVQVPGHLFHYILHNSVLFRLSGAESDRTLSRPQALMRASHEYSAGDLQTPLNERDGRHGRPSVKEYFCKQHVVTKNTITVRRCTDREQLISVLEQAQ